MTTRRRSTSISTAPPRMAAPPITELPDEADAEATATTPKPESATVGSTMRLLRVLKNEGFTRVTIHPSFGIPCTLNLSEAVFTSDGMSASGVILVSGSPALEERLRLSSAKSITVRQAPVGNLGNHLDLGANWRSAEIVQVDVSAEDVSVPV